MRKNVKDKPDQKGLAHLVSYWPHVDLIWTRGPTAKRDSAHKVFKEVTYKLPKSSVGGTFDSMAEDEAVGTKEMKVLMLAFVSFPSSNLYFVNSLSTPTAMTKAGNIVLLLSPKLFNITVNDDSTK